MDDLVKEARYEVLLPTALMSQTLRYIEVVKIFLGRLFPRQHSLETCFELGIGYDCLSEEGKNGNYIPGIKEPEGFVFILG